MANNKLSKDLEESLDITTQIEDSNKNVEEEATMVAPPDYVSAQHNIKNNKKRVAKIMKDKQKEAKVIEPKETIKEGLTLDESLFEDVVAKPLNESYSDMGSAITKDGKKVMAVGTTSSTRTYNYEHVTFRYGNKEGNGKYRWLNRPWQRFDFASALAEAMVDAGIDKKFVYECIENAHNLDSAVEYFAEHIDDINEGIIGTALGAAATGAITGAVAGKVAGDVASKRIEKKMNEVLVDMDDDVVVDMLVDRVEFWTDDAQTKELYRKMYQNYVDDGLFEGQKLNIMEIVDNDYVNYCDIIEEGDENYEAVKQAFDNGEYEVEDVGYIEAEDDGVFLVRVH